MSVLRQRRMFVLHCPEIFTGLFMFDCQRSARMRLIALGVATLLLSACGPGGSDSASDERAPETGTSRSAAPPVPGASGESSQRAVISERLPYGEVGDELVYGHFVFPSDMVEPLPAIIVIHEWWGLNDTVREMAEKIAAEGYIVLAVDLFERRTAEDAPAARQLMIDVVEQPDPAKENIRQAYEFLTMTAGAPAVGVLGWGFGGQWALNAAMLLPDELDAAVIYYGQVVTDEDQLRPISAPILAFFGAEDRGIRVDDVREFEKSLKRLRKVYEINVYDNVTHSFANPTHRNFRPGLAERAWETMLEFLERHLTTAGP